MHHDLYADLERREASERADMASIQHTEPPYPVWTDTDAMPDCDQTREDDLYATYTEREAWDTYQQFRTLYGDASGLWWLGCLVSQVNRMHRDARMAERDRLPRCLRDTVPMEDSGL